MEGIVYYFESRCPERVRPLFQRAAQSAAEIVEYAKRERRRPLTLTLSPEDRGEGIRKRVLPFFVQNGLLERVVDG